MRCKYFLALGLIATGMAQADDLITLHFYERPPYMMKDGNGATGITASAAEAVFSKADIAFKWQITPAKRQLILLKEDGGQDCGLGWYKTLEREKFGKFTAPISRDHPTVALLRSGYTPPSQSLAAIVVDPKVRILMKEGLTYGQDVIRIMSHPNVKANVQKVTGEQTQLARMIAGARADFMFSPQEESRMLVTSKETGPYSLKVFTFSDVNVGETRHILCSKKVSDEVISKLNTALAAMTNPVK